MLTNKWYRNDNMVKIGKHCSDNIENLLTQYSSRYIPKKELISFWNVQDCTTIESIIYDTLKYDDQIERVEGEWFRGPIDYIVELLDVLIDECENDPFLIQLNINGVERVYPLSMISDERLIKIGNIVDIDNPLDISDSRWRTLQMSLLLLQERIITLFESNEKLKDETLKKFSYLTDYSDDENLLSRLYIHVNPHITSRDAFSLAKRLSLITTHSKRDIQYSYTCTPSEKLRYQLSQQRKIQEENYEDMIVRDLLSLS